MNDHDSRDIDNVRMAIAKYILGVNDAINCKEDVYKITNIANACKNSHELTDLINSLASKILEAKDYDEKKKAIDSLFISMNFIEDFFRECRLAANGDFSNWVNTCSKSFIPFHDILLVEDGIVGRMVTI